jgi:acyl carrier protein
MFAAIRAEYGIPRDDMLKLRDFPTLGHAMQFVYDRRPDLKKQVAVAPPVRGTAAAAAAEPGTGTAPASSSSVDPIKERILLLISEKTGYPIDMLDLELDLEADLGIDTVKQAEVFAAIRAEYGIARDDTLKLRDFPTLAHTIKFVYDRRPDLKERGAEGRGQRAEGKEQDAATVPTFDPVKEKVLQLISEKTGYPIDMLDLELDLEADLGIDTVKQAEVFAAIRAEYGIPRDDMLKLRDFPTLAHTIKFVYDRKPDLKKPVAETPVVTHSSGVPHVTTPTSTAVPNVLGDMAAANRVRVACRCHICVRHWSFATNRCDTQCK